MYDDSPDELIHDLFLQTMWSGSNLGEPTIGFAETVTRVTPDDLRAHMRAHYAPNSVVVAAAGNVEHDRFVELVSEQFDGFGGACVLPEPERPATTPSRHVRYKESEQAYVVLGTRGIDIRDDRRYALSLLDTVLGGGMSSRLFQEIREKRGLVYSVYSFQAAYRGAGLFGVYAGTSPENVQACIDVIVDQFGRVRNAPIKPRRVPARQGAYQRKPHALAGVHVEPDDPARPQRVRARAARERRGDRAAHRRRDGRRGAGVGARAARR